MFVGELVEQGLSARFQPVSAFLGSTPPDADVLLVVSQYLSPNARIPLRHRGRYAAVFVVTSLDAHDERCAHLASEGVLFLTHAPPDESGLLLRVIGPALATRMVLHLAASIAASHGRAPPAWTSRVQEIAPAMERARSRVAAIDPEWVLGPSAIVTTGSDGDRAVGLRTKLLEAFSASDPPVWDLCGLVHGPLQSFFDSRRLLFVLEPAGDPMAGLLRRRLEQIVVHERHRIHVIEAQLPAPLSFFEYAAAFDAIVVQTLRARPRDLGNWPAKGRDGAIYEIDGNELRD
jgi:hypothetical protein